MDRRRFLKKAFLFCLGATFGFGGFSRSPAHAYSERRITPRLALIIDDIGFSLGRARAFFRIGIPLTFSILPRLLYSKELMFEAFDHRHEVMLHQPMEPYDNCSDPGPGALYSGCPREEIDDILADNMSEVPFAAGVNNHMGSLFTTRPDDIGNALQYMKNRNLYFIDSVTSAKSVAFRTARNLEMTAEKRNVFLDVVVREEMILHQLFVLQRHAQIKGYAIGIGHPFPETANAIERFATLHGPDISFVHVSKLLYH